MLCSFLSTPDIKTLKLVCAAFARRVGSSNVVRLRLTARKLAWERMMEPQRKAARAAWREYAQSQRGSAVDESCFIL